LVLLEYTQSFTEDVITWMLDKIGRVKSTEDLNTTAVRLPIIRVVHGTYLSVPFPSHIHLCLSHPMGFPLHYYNINMEYNTIKIIKFMKV